MQVTDYVCGSCAAASISGLGEHKDAFDAMVAFCRAALGEGGGRYSTADQPKYATLNSHYIFIAGPEAAEGEGGRSHHSKAWTKYGTEFAQYILDRKLGIVATCGQILNLKYHATTTCQVWVWQPFQKELEAWWTAANAEAARIAKEEAAAKAAYMAKLKVALAEVKDGKVFTQIQHHGYSPDRGIPAARSVGQLLTIHKIRGEYAYYETTGKLCQAYPWGERNNILPLGSYVITAADSYYWTLMQIPADVKLPTPPVPLKAGDKYVEPPLADVVVAKPVETVMKRRWKYEVQPDGTKKRAYYMVEGAALARAYSVNPMEPVEAQEVT